MAWTDYSGAKEFSDKYPKTFFALQEFVYSIATLIKNVGKIGFFGKDKGAIAGENFVAKLDLLIQAMVTERIVNATSNDHDEITKTILRFQSIFPNWQAEYAVMPMLLDKNWRRIQGLIQYMVQERDNL